MVLKTGLNTGSIPRFFWLLVLYQLTLMVGLHPSSPVVILPAVLLALAAVRLAWSNRLKELHYCIAPPVFWGIWLYSAIAWLAVIVVRYYSLGYSLFDTGIYANGVEMFRQTGRYVSPILGMPALGEHFTPNLLLFAPLLSINQTFLWFPLVKLVAFLCSPFILFRLGHRILGPDSKFIAVAPILFLVHRYVLSTVQMEFQPSGLALPFVFLAFLFAYDRSYLKLTLTLLFLLGFKEHLALIWVSVGCYLAFVKDDKSRGFLYSTAGCLLGFAIYFLVMPYFAEGASNSHSHRFSPTALFDAKLLLIVKALCSVGCIPLLAPRMLPAIVCSFGIALASNQEQMLSFEYHYQDIALAVVFVGVIHGLQTLSVHWSRIADARYQRVAVILLTTCVISFATTRYPSRIIKREWPTPDQLQLFSKIQEARQTLNRAQPLWTLNQVGPYFFDFPMLHPILLAQPPFQPGAQVLLTKNVTTWPLSAAEYAEMSEFAHRSAGVVVRDLGKGALK